MRARLVRVVVGLAVAACLGGNAAACGGDVSLGDLGTTVSTSGAGDDDASSSESKGCSANVGTRQVASAEFDVGAVLMGVWFACSSNDPLSFAQALELGSQLTPLTTAADGSYQANGSSYAYRVDDTFGDADYQLVVQQGSKPALVFDLYVFTNPLRFRLIDPATGQNSDYVPETSIDFSLPPSDAGAIEDASNGLTSAADN